MKLALREVRLPPIILTIEIQAPGFGAAGKFLVWKLLLNEFHYHQHYCC